MNDERDPDPTIEDVPDMDDDEEIAEPKNDEVKEPDA
jgi:hypothetical protein